MASALSSRVRLLECSAFVDSLVLRQIRAIRKALAALVADVRLRTFVHVHMRRESRLDREAFPTLRADVLFRPGVSRLMILQLLFRNEASPTARVFTLMRLVAGMTVDVPRELWLVAEGLGLTAAGPVAMVVSARLAAR